MSSNPQSLPSVGPPARRRSVLLAAAAAVVALATACGPGSTAASAPAGPARELRLGYLANVTHAPALVGVSQGFFAKQLGTTKLSTQVFNAGPAAIEALNAGAIDAAYLGPNPAINGFVRSDGQALRIIAGATSGGAQLVVKPEITSAAQLKGKNLATPQLGGTQDVALRAWLADQGLKTDRSGGGDVAITPTENAQTFQLFQQGRIDGAWVPEPWASRLVLDAGAKVLVDEKDLWPKGQFVTTHLIVSTTFLTQHPETVAALLRGHVEAVDWIKANAAKAPAVVNAEIAKTAGKPLSDAVIARAFSGITVTVDPLASSLQKDFSDGVTAGLVKKADLKGIYDLRPLNAVLTAKGLPTVSTAGLGDQ
ncbi:MAG: ABC transporter substrate-binding protein [Actinomycetota bacterium]